MARQWRGWSEKSPSRRRLFIAQLIRKLKDSRARDHVAVFGKPAEEVRIFLYKVMTVLAHAHGFLRHVMYVAVIGLSMVEIFGPGDAVADSQWITPATFTPAGFWPSES